MSEAHAETLVRDVQHFRAERSADKLPSHRPIVFVRGILISSVGEVQQVVCNGCSILRIEIGVNFIENIEWRRVGGLDGENQGKTAQTWMR